MTKAIDRFPDADRKIKQLPSKQSMRIIVYAYLAEKFESKTEYSEKEVNP